MDVVFTGEIEKFDIKLKTKPKDGVILQLHHTLRSANGERRRIRFASANFDDKNDKLSCSDNAGNIFILDFADLKFWKLPAIGRCSALHFDPFKIDTLIIAQLEENLVTFVDIETGITSLTLAGHTSPVRHISFSNWRVATLLTASVNEAILWELKNYTKFFTLNTYLDAQIQKILFTPGGDYLVACFQNDTVQIWKHDSMRSVKQIIPSELKHIKSIALTMNGRAMAMAGLSPTLILFSMDTWRPIKSINLTKYKIHGIQDLAFIPQEFDGGANKILSILGNDCNLYLFDTEHYKITQTLTDISSNVKKFIVSPSGKYFLCILKLGEMNIYNSTFLVSSPCPQESRKPTTGFHTMATVNKTLSRIKVEDKMRTCMDSARLRRILMQYGEYPDKFRPAIWSSLLNIPKNKAAYSALVENGIHQSYKNIEDIFTIHSQTTLKSLKRLLSCLAHWSPLFGVMKFLPGFTFPFVKVLQKNPLLLFECVATVLLNHCQLWFEYAPFPPLSVLAMIENILAEHDQQLLEHFCNVGITSQTYALKILETAFSEVLNSFEWLILWDHILSNEPSFILMAVVSYNIVQRNILKRYKTQEEMELFFHVQHPIDKKVFLKKTYTLLEETSKDNHPRQFLSGFNPLESGDSYQQFSGYPKATICLKFAKKDSPKKFKKYTLKELTKKSQEKLINNNMFVDSDSDDSEGCGDRNEKINKKHKKPKETRDDYDKIGQFYCKNDVKNELLRSLYVTDTMENIRLGPSRNRKQEGQDPKYKNTRKKKS